MKTTFKPKSLKVQVPTHGVIDREDFNDIHLKACLKQIEAAGLNKDAYLTKRFDLVSYGDLPLFDETEDFRKAELEAAKAAEEEAKAEQDRKDAEALKAFQAEELRKAEEAELEAAIKAEEELKKSSEPK